MVFGGDSSSMFCPLQVMDYAVLRSQSPMFLDVVVPQGKASHARNNCADQIIEFRYKSNNKGYITSQ
jgi:hypothetical protein